MIVIVLGMHKSGTTLVAKTLHESGIDMGVKQSGDYPKCKYEDPRVSEITKYLLYGKNKRHSLEIPRPLFETEIDGGLIKRMNDYVIERVEQEGYNWGFKFPDVTLCYGTWKEVLPCHIAVGVKRKRENIIAHYMRQSIRHTISEINMVCDLYESALSVYNVPVINYEDYMTHGPGQLEEIVGMKLKDCRRYGK